MQYNDAITKVALALGVEVNADHRIAIMAGLVNARVTGDDALKAASVLLHDHELDNKLRYKGRLSAADFLRALESLPRKDIPYTLEEVREFIRMYGYEREDFPVTARDPLQDTPIHKFVPRLVS